MWWYLSKAVFFRSPWIQIVLRYLSKTVFFKWLWIQIDAELSLKCCFLQGTLRKFKSILSSLQSRFLQVILNSYDFWALSKAVFSRSLCFQIDFDKSILKSPQSLFPPGHFEFNLFRDIYLKLFSPDHCKFKLLWAISPKLFFTSLRIQIVLEISLRNCFHK